MENVDTELEEISLNTIKEQFTPQRQKTFKDAVLFGKPI